MLGETQEAPSLSSRILLSFSDSLSLLFLLPPSSPVCLQVLPLFVFTQRLNKATVTVTEAGSIEAQGLGLRGQMPDLAPGAAT